MALVHRLVLATTYLLCVNAPLFAQDHLVLGRYVGTLQAINIYGVTVGVGLEVVIESIEGGLVRATAISYAKPSLCGGTYPMLGTHAGNKLTLKASSLGGPRKDCGLHLRLAVEGNKLVGETAVGYPVQLIKR